MTTSRLKEYKDNDFNEVLRKAENLLEANTQNSSRLQELKDITDMTDDQLAQYQKRLSSLKNQGQNLKTIGAEQAKRQQAKTVLQNTSDIAQLQGNLATYNQTAQQVQTAMKDLQAQVQAGQKDRETAQQEMTALKQQLQDLMAAQQKAQEEAAKQNAPITPQDAQLSQNYINKALTTGDISKKINQLLPKISPSFKGDNFTITKISPVNSNDPNTLQFKVNFALEGGSKGANKFLDSQDPAFQNAMEFLESLDEDHFSEGVMSAIGSAVGKVAGGIKQGLADVKSGFSNGAQTKASSSNYQAAQAKEPMLGQYLQKALTQAFQDVVAINGKNFDVNISNVKAGIDKQAAADQLQTAADEAEAKEQRDAKIAQTKQKAKDTLTAAGKGIAKGAKAEGEGIAKGAKAIGKGIVKGAKAVADNVKAAAKPGDYGQNNNEELNLGGFDEKLHEGLLVKKGSFIVKMTLADAPKADNQAVAAQPTQQPVQQQVQQQPTQTQAANPNPSSAGATGTNNINIYNNGNPQQPAQQGQGQQATQKQQNNTPFWWDAASPRQQKKFVKNMMKPAKQAKSGTSWFFNNTYGSQMGNSPTTATGWK